MHIVYIITKLELGGAQKVCLSLFNNMLAQNISASLITSDQGPLLESVKDNPNVFTINALKREVGLFSWWQEIKAFGTMISILKKLKKQHPKIVVHTHSTKAGILGRWAALFAGIPHRVHTVHGYGFHEHQAWIPWLAIFTAELITAPLTSHFVCVSEKDQLKGKQLLPKFSGSSSIIRAAVADVSFYPALLRQGFEGQATHNTPFIIGSVSCFKPQKNLLDLIDAFALLVARTTTPIELHIIGDGTMRIEIERRIHFHNLRDKVLLLGWQSNVHQFMRDWSLYAMSSLWEGLPCSVVEARLCKLPVVCYNVGGIYEIIKDHHNGILVPPGNVKLLAEALYEYIENKTLMNTATSYNDNLSEFYEQAMIQHHTLLYQSLTKTEQL